MLVPLLRLEALLFYRPGTRPLLLRELADFDFNEKGHLVVKEHSSYGQPVNKCVSLSDSAKPVFIALVVT